MLENESKKTNTAASFIARAEAGPSPEKETVSARRIDVLSRVLSSQN